MFASPLLIMLHLSTFVSVLLIFVFPCVESGPGPIVQDLEDSIKLRVFRAGNSYYYEEAILREGLQLLTTSESFDPAKSLVLIFHGMDWGVEGDFVRGLIDAFGTSGKSDLYNVLALDMLKHLTMGYPPVIAYYLKLLGNVEMLGFVVGNFLCEMINSGLTRPEKINFIGYSLGAHMSGYAARQIQSRYGPINFIVGLDPAGPGFSYPYKRPLNGMVHLSHVDARLVHLVHSNYFHLGSGEFRGHVDFVLNNGMTQPGCVSAGFWDACSHVRSTYVFAQAILDERFFVARHCDSWLSFAVCRCPQGPFTSISFPPDEGARGKYFLWTSQSRPYGMGPRGSMCYLMDYWTRPTQKAVVVVLPEAIQ